MISLNSEEKRRIGYLQGLCNRYGDFKVARSWTDSKGEMKWTKHRSVMECWESEDGINWLAHVNNRGIQPAEIILDLDDSPTEQRMNEICDKLDKAGEQYKAYFTGSRGYHIHIWNQDFATWQPNQREKARRIIIALTGCDGMKASERMLICLEDAPNGKTGRNKTLLRENPHG